jgi:glycosyltransferase involved in cell wall biosynthesis
VQSTRQPKTPEINSSEGLADAGIKISKLSAGDKDPHWAIALFAYNSAETIQAALNSVVAAADNDISIYVLANGCTDHTVDIVRSSAATLPNLWLVEIPHADKAAAWNIFVHDLITEERAGALEAWFFMDSDVTLAPGSMRFLTSRLEDAADAVAVGGMPGSGRDMDAWRRRMVYNGMLAGNYYALRGSFVNKIRQAQVRMPAGLIGEDFFLSWLVANISWDDTEPTRRAHCAFDGRAEFLFRSLSPLRPPDYRAYLQRKWRYTLRDFQHQMLIMLILQKGLGSVPLSVEELYHRAPLPVRPRWAGILQTPLNLLALRKIRSFR